MIWSFIFNIYILVTSIVNNLKCNQIYFWELLVCESHFFKRIITTKILMYHNYIYLLAVTTAILQCDTLSSVSLWFVNDHWHLTDLFFFSQEGCSTTKYSLLLPNAFFLTWKILKKKHKNSQSIVFKKKKKTIIYLCTKVLIWLLIKNSKATGKQNSRWI